MGRKLLLTALVVTASGAVPTVAHTASEVGRSYEIRRSYEATSRSGDEGSGSSSGHDTIIEHVVAERDGGLELEFDYPVNTRKEQQARDWQFPVLVFRSVDGEFSLLNMPAVEKRIEDWLKQAKIDRSACGSWYFSWTAFKIECDPLAVLKTVAGFDIRMKSVGAGQLYKSPGTIQPAPLREVPSSGAKSFIVDLRLDPEVWQREAAESDVVVAQLMRKPLNLDEAISQRAKVQVSGTIKVQLELGDSPTQVVRRTTLTHTEINPTDQPFERQTRKEVVERKPLS